MSTRNTKALIQGIFSTDCLTNLEEDVPLDILRMVCENMKNNNGFQLDTIENYLISKKETTYFDPTDGSVLVYSSPLIFACLFDDYHYKTEELIRHFASITHNNKATVDVVVEYTNLLHDIFWQKLTKEDILEILPELDILEDEVPVSSLAKDVFFTALWCFTMTDSYEQACVKASKLDFNIPYIVEVTGAIAGLYYGFESIPTSWSIKAEDKYEFSKIIF